MSWWRKPPGYKEAKVIFNAVYKLFPYRRETGEIRFTIKQCIERGGGD